MIYDDFLKHFKVKSIRGPHAQCICPAHHDKKASLSITRGDDKTLICCHAGCDYKDILGAVDLKPKDLYYQTTANMSWQQYVEKKKNKKIEKTYNYVRSDTGEYAYTKLRLEGKDICYGLLKNEKFHFGLGGKSKKNYKAIYGDLKKIKAAIEQGEKIFIPEGEKDVDTLNSKGYVAFTYGGSSDWQKELSEVVKNADVYILGDNDEPGKKVVYQIAMDIKGVAKSLHILYPCKDKKGGDISDYFNDGGTKEEFEKMLVDIDSANELSSFDDMSLFSDMSMADDNSEDLRKFHITNDKGEITRVHDNAIFEDIKSNNDIFVFGKNVYIYLNGCYRIDASEAWLKSLIRSYIFSEFIKSTTINRIHKLFYQDSELEVKYEEINNYPKEWINFQNGMFDPINNVINPHDAKYKAIYQIQQEYFPDRKHEGSKIDQYLESLCPTNEDKEMLLQFIGYCMTVDTRQQKFLIIRGRGGTGKSILLRLISHIIGSENIANLSVSELQERFGPYTLLGKGLNICGEIKPSVLEDVTNIKKIIGEDRMKAEQKGKDLIFFTSFAKMIFSTNEVPLINGEKTNGFYRRLLILTVNGKQHEEDPKYYQELETESGHLLCLAVEALVRMYKNGHITESKSSSEAVRKLWQDSDSVQGFIDECCRNDANARINRTNLYVKYESYCNALDFRPFSKSEFYRSLQVKGYSQRKSGNNRFIIGITIKAPNEQFTPIPDDFAKELNFGGQ